MQKYHRVFAALVTTVALLAAPSVPAQEAKSKAATKAEAKTKADAKSEAPAKGEKFEKLAERSKDTGSKANGGDLDWNAPSNFVKPFGDAMVALQKGKFTTAPVQTQFGWHVIQLDDVRDAKIPSFEEVKPQLQQR